MRYRVTVEGGNEEFPVPEFLAGGTECSGFLLLTFADGKPQSSVVQGVNPVQVGRMLLHDEDPAVNSIHQAMAILKGVMAASEIRRKCRDRKNGQGSDRIADAIADALLRQLNGEEDADPDEI